MFGRNISFTSGNGDFVLYDSGQHHTVLTTTNISMPLWIPVATNTFEIDGHFTFTSHIDPSESQRYFRLQLQ